MSATPQSYERISDLRHVLQFLLVVAAAACLLSGSVPAREMFAIQVKCTHGIFCEESTVTWCNLVQRNYLGPM